MSDDELIFSFLNWDYENVTLEFESTLEFRWHTLPLLEEIDDDIAYEVCDSQWLKELFVNKKLEEKTAVKYRHYQLCVYGSGLLEVVAEDFGVSKEKSAVAANSWVKSIL